MHAIVSYANYFKPIILKFSTCIYKGNGKIILNFCMYADITSSVGEGRHFLPFAFSEKKPRDMQNLWLNHTSVIIQIKIYLFFFFSFFTKKQNIDFFRTFMIILLWVQNHLYFLKLSCCNLYMLHVSQNGLGLPY